jgi:hypothetical protein
MKDLSSLRFAAAVAALLLASNPGVSAETAFMRNTIRLLERLSVVALLAASLVIAFARSARCSAEATETPSGA